MDRIFMSAPAGVTIVRVTPEATRPLRQQILRPHQSVDELCYSGDDDPLTLHVAAFADDAMIGTASVYREPPPGVSDPTAWRLRGMAVIETRQGTGIGRRLVDACIEHLRGHGGGWLWCNARVPAAGFYQKLGFAIEGEPFDLPQIGPHCYMWRSIEG
jgi:hypothetical protein